jgi:hypothetical protein
MADFFWLIVPRRKWTFSMPIPHGSDYRHIVKIIFNSAHKKLWFAYVYRNISGARAWKIVQYILNSWKIVQSQLRTRLIFEIARLTANFVKFVRVGAIFNVLFI